MSIWFTSFYPLCLNKEGLEAIENGKFPRFIDGSCRREPDFQNDTPCITGLCRPGFSKKLKKDDLVIYTTNKRGIGSKRLVAILEVIMEPIDGHKNAADWYLSKKLLLPNNLMVSDNKPFNLDQTHQMGVWDGADSWGQGKKNTGSLAKWDCFYKQRAINHPHVAICRVWNNILDLETPIIMTTDDLKYTFERIPGTETPPRLRKEEEVRFLDWLSHNSKITL